jgi:tetratricopeptide (TPR) repeat protein
MQSISMRATKKTIKNRDVFQPKKLFAPLFLAVFSLLLLMAPSLSSGVEKTPKAQPKAQSKPQTQAKPLAMPIQKETIVNDANLMAHQKRVEDLVGKSDFNGALKIMLKINDYTKEVLFTVKNIKTEYEKAVSDPKVPQKDKEDLFIKMRGLNQLIPRYTNYYEASTFNLGYMYAKLGETEKARKYLVEFLQMTPYSGGRDSQWMKAKTLLLELYSLEGEF